MSLMISAYIQVFFREYSGVMLYVCDDLGMCLEIEHLVSVDFFKRGLSIYSVKLAVLTRPYC
jgi:hypothetical protein